MLRCIAGATQENWNDDFRRSGRGAAGVGDGALAALLIDDGWRVEQSWVWPKSH